MNKSRLSFTCLSSSPLLKWDVTENCKNDDPKLDATSIKKIWMFRRMISCRIIWSFLVTAIRHLIFLHVCFLLLFWRECRILLITWQFFLLLNLYSMPIFHRSLFKFMGVRYCWGCYCLFWYNMVWNFLKITKLFRSDGWHPPD